MMCSFILYEFRGFKGVNCNNRFQFQNRSQLHVNFSLHTACLAQCGQVGEIFRPAGGKSVAIGAGALLATSAAVVHVLAHIGLASVLLVAIAVTPARCAFGSALASGAAGNAVRVGRAAHTAASAVLHVLAHVGLASVLFVAIAVAPAGCAFGSAFASGAAGNAVGVSGAAHTAASAVLHVLAHIGLASVLHVLVAVLPELVAHVLALSVVALGAAVGVRLA